MRWKRRCRRLWAVLRDKFYIDELYGATVIAFYAWWARVADWFDRRSGAESSPPSRLLFRGLGAVQSLLRSNSSWTAASTRAAKRSATGGGLLARVQSGRVQTLSAVARRGGGRAGRDPDLEQPPMNECNGFPILTLLTVLPVVGAAIALFVGQDMRASWRMVTGAGCAWRCRWSIWTQFAGRRIHRACGAARVGAFAGHRVSPRRGWAGRADAGALGARDADVRWMRRIACITQPGSVISRWCLLLEAGLFGTFTALNFFHWFLFWELSLIPAFFLIKLWGGPKRGPAATQFFVYTMAGSVALLLAFLAVFLATGSMEFHASLAAWPSTGELEQMVTAASARPARDDVACDRRAGGLCGEGAADAVSYLAARRLREAPSPVTMLLTGAMSKMGVYGLLRIALPMFGAQIAQIRTPLLVLAVVTVVMGAWAAAAQKDLKRVFAYSSVNHLGYCLLGIFALAVPARERCDGNAARRRR